MKRRAYKIELSYACNQIWSELPEKDGGLYCKDCSRVVQDFTTLSDDALIARLSQPPAGGLCGVFSQHQLNRVYVPVPSRSQRSWKTLKLLLLGLFTLRLPVSAQEQAGGAATEQVQPDKQQAGIPPPAADPLPDVLLNPPAACATVQAAQHRIRIEELNSLIKLQADRVVMTGGVPMIVHLPFNLPSPAAYSVTTVALPAEKPKKSLRFTLTERLRNKPR